MARETCTYEGCEKPRESRWRCAEHWARGNLRCSVEDCDSKHYGKGLCRFHWTRQTEGRVLDAPRFEPHGGCSVEGCERPHTARGWCKVHLGRFYATGDPLAVKPPAGGQLVGEANATWKGDECGYHAVHKRLASHRGPARDFDCADCGGPAHQWSYDHSDPDERVSKDGPYSTDLDHYSPRCRSCHVRLDRCLVVG